MDEKDKFVEELKSLMKKYGVSIASWPDRDRTDLEFIASGWSVRITEELGK